MSLRDAAQALVDRWDTPLWKDVPATGEYINRLREELAAAPKVEQELTPQSPQAWRDARKMAIDALEEARTTIDSMSKWDRLNKALDALRGLENDNG